MLGLLVDVDEGGGGDECLVQAEQEVKCVETGPLRECVVKTSSPYLL